MHNLIPPLPEYKPADQSGPENGDIAEVPVGFDPVANPILAEHFFGLRPQPQAGTVSADLYRLGPRPVVVAST